MEGIIIKGFGGFYIASAEGNIYTCSLRGRIKKNSDIRINVGDRVEITPLEAGKGVVEEILPRTTELIRPRIANATQCLLLFAAKDPDIDFTLLDRLLILVESSGLKPVIVFNKIDLNENIASVAKIYRAAGYDVILVSAELGQGQEELHQVLAGQVTVLAGPSGAGKSSTLNMLKPELDLQVGEISEKLGRGKHTTRYVELWELSSNTFVADTPGFSRLDLPESITTKNLYLYYKDFLPFADECKFLACMHHREDECGVKKALELGQINQDRYGRYLLLLDELKEREDKKYD